MGRRHHGRAGGGRGRRGRCGHGGGTLAEARRQQRVRVTRISGGRRLVHRLAALGIVPGVVVKVTRSRGPALIGIGNTRIAIGRGAARAIEVEAVEE